MARISADARRKQLLTHAVWIANRSGLGICNAVEVARCADCSVETVRKHFHNQDALWSAVLSDKRAHKGLKKEAVALGII